MSQITKLFLSKTAWTLQRFNRTTLVGVAILFGFPISIPQAVTQSGAHDPGVRSGPAGAGASIAGLTQNQRNYFAAGLAEFSQVDAVKDGLGRGLTPRAVPNVTLNPQLAEAALW